MGPQQMLAAVSSSGHLLRNLKEHLLEVCGVFQFISAHLSGPIPFNSQPMLSKQLWLPWTAAFSSWTCLLSSFPARKKELREVSGIGSENSFWYSFNALNLWGSSESHIKCLICSISFTPGPDIPGMDEKHGVFSSTKISECESERES